jgi:hypothetical protein
VRLIQRTMAMTKRVAVQQYNNNNNTHEATP